jgi:hypothetical protein
MSHGEAVILVVTFLLFIIAAGFLADVWIKMNKMDDTLDRIEAQIKALKEGSPT